MKEVELVVKIPEETYKGIMLGKWDRNGLAYYVKDGTPLPKGHGAIKDVSQIEIPMCEDRAYERWVQVAIDAAPTIIEADRSEEE